MREARLIFTLLTVMIAMVNGYPDPQSRRLVLRYNRYLGKPQSDFVYYNPPLDSYHENYNPYQSPIIFKPLESDLSQQSSTGHKSLNEITEETAFALDTLISRKLADVGKMKDDMSKVEDKIIEDANKMEDKLNYEVNKYQNGLTDEVSKFDEEINGREVRNVGSGENSESSSIYFKDVRNANNNEDIPHKEYNNDPRIYFKDPVVSDPDNMDSNIDANFDDSPIRYVESDYNTDTSWPKTTESKYEIDSTHINPGIKFEKLINGAPIDEERKERTERAASYSISGTRWNNYNGNYGPESVNYPRAHQQPNPFHSMGRDYGSSGYYVDRHEAQRETRGYMIGPNRPYNHHHINPAMIYNTGYDRNRGYGGNRQISDAENRGQREYDGQEQTHDLEFERHRGYNNKPNIQKQIESKREYDAKQTEYNTHSAKHIKVQREYGDQEQIDEDEFDDKKEYRSHQQTIKFQFGGQREYGSQKQIGDVEFDSQSEYGGQTDDVEFGSQQQIDNIQFGGQRKYGGQKLTNKEEFHDQREYGGQEQTDKVDFGSHEEHVSQKPSDNVQFGGQRGYNKQKQIDKIEFNGQMEYGGQEQTDNVDFGSHEEHVGQKPSDNVQFGGQRGYNKQKQIDKVEFNDQMEYGGQEQTDKVEFENQREHTAPETDYSNYRGQEQTDNVEFGRQGKYDGQHQTDNVQFGVQREYGGQRQTPKAKLDGQMEYSGQQQTDKVEFVNQREHTAPEQTDYSNYRGQEQTDNVEFGSQGEYYGQHQTDNVQFGGQREYSGQQQTDKVEFGNQREHDGQHQTDIGEEVQFGSEHQTGNIQFGGQQQTGDVPFDGQHQTDDIQFGGQQQTGDVSFDGQQQTDDIQFGGQQQTADVPFGGQQQTDDVPFDGQHQTDDVQFGGQQQTDDVPFDGQYQTDDIQFGGQQQTDDVPFDGQHQTDDIQFGGQQLTDDVPFDGQHQTDDVQFGGQQQTDDVPFDGQHQTDDIQFGGQQQTDDVPFDGQHQTDDIQFGGQQQTDDVPFGGQQQTDDVPFDGQHQTDDIQFGGQQQTDDVRFGGQKQTNKIQFGGQAESGSLPNEFDRQKIYDSRHTNETVFGVKREYGGHVPPENHKFDKGDPQLSASYIPGAINQNPYRPYIGQSQVKTETQMHGGYSGSRKTDISTYGNARKYDNPHQTKDAHSAQGGNQQSGYNVFNNQRAGNQNNQRGYEHNGNKYLSSQGYYEELDEQSRTKTESKNLFFNIGSNSSPTISPSYQNPGYSGSRQKGFSSFGSGSYSHGYSNQPDHTKSGYVSQRYNGIPTQRNNYATPTLIHPDDNQRFSEQKSALLPERVMTSTPVGVNRYKKVESLLDELEKDLIEEQADKSIEGFIPTVKASSSAAYTTANRYMESPTDSRISYTPYLTPSPPQFEYNSDEEEEKPSFWSNLGNKMKNTYNQAKDKTKQVISNIKEKIAS